MQLCGVVSVILRLAGFIRTPTCDKQTRHMTTGYDVQVCGVACGVYVCIYVCGVYIACVVKVTNS